MTAANKMKAGFYDVELIVSHRNRREKIEYQVKWEGYPSTENTWEPPENIPEWLTDDYDRYHQIGKYFSTDCKLNEIVNIERNRDGILIAMVKFNGQSHFQYILAEWVNKNYPSKMIRYYEDRLYWRTNRFGDLIKVNAPKW